MLMPETDLKKYTKPSRFAEERVPSIEEVKQAIEQPAEANPLVLAYIRNRPELVENIRTIGPAPDQP
jgi:hypothetical protein